MAENTTVMKIPFSAYDFFGYLACGFLLLCAADYAFDGGWLLKENIWTVYVVFYTGVAYVVGHIVAHLSSFFLEHKFLRGVLVSPEETLFDEEKRKGLWPCIFPIFYKAFPPETRKRVLEKAKTFDIVKPGRGLFFHCHPIVLRENQVSERLNSFLNLYGFCRNTSMATLLAVPLLVFGMIANGFDEGKMWWIVVAAVVAIGMFYRYLKFFKHYTEEVFRTYAELPDKTS